MAGRAPPDVRERAVALLTDVKALPDSPAKLDCLKELKDLAIHREQRLLPELLPYLLELRNDPAMSVRNIVVDIIEEAGLKFVEYVSVMMPVLLAFLQDNNAVFVRRGITAGTNLFRNTFEHVLLKGIYTRQVDKFSQDSWLSVVHFKDTVYPLAQQHGNDGVRLHAIKFIETVILLYTPDPTGSQQPPPPDRADGVKGVNLAWIVSGHPLLDAAAMGQEAGKALNLLMNQLRQNFSTLPGPVAIVLINSLAAIAKKRPSFYGRVLPVLLSLGPSSEAIKGAQASVVSALKNAYVQLLKCTHASAGPWKERLNTALRQMSGGDATESTVERNLRSSERDSRPIRARDERILNDPRKRPQENGGEEEFVKRLRNTPPPPVQPPQQQDLTQALASANGSGPTLPPIQQMIQMFEGLAAQGDTGNIDMLMARLPIDTLAELVMFNMQNLPPSAPSDPPEKMAPVPPPLPPPFELIPADARRDPRRDPRRLDPRRPSPPVNIKQEVKQELRHEETHQPPLLRAPVKVEQTPPPAVNSRDPRASLRTSSVVRPESVYPQIKQEPDEDIPSRPAPSSYEPPSDDSLVKQEQPSGPTFVPVVPLTIQERVALGKSSLMRILEGHKSIMAAGGGELRIALLARLSSQSAEDLETLQKHILADYANNMGHELAMHVLYELYARHIAGSESEPTLRTYDGFFLSLAHALKDTLPTTDRSLGKLLCEAPLLPNGAFQILDSLCKPENDTSDRITQGLTVLWSLILQRPAVREKCLEMALACAVHEVEDLRTKAIRLVANKLYQVAAISQKIEDFASHMMHTVTSVSQEENTPQEEDGKPQGPSVAEAQRCMSLYFGLCIKKHTLFGELFKVYAKSVKPVKHSIHKQIPVLIRTVGQASPELLKIISDPPPGSENLLLQVVNVLTEGTTPSPELINTVKQLHETKLKDPVFLIPILSSLSKDEVLPIFPRLVDLPQEKFQIALARILQGSAHNGPALTPEEVLIAIHGIDPQRDSVPLKKVTDACSACLQQRSVFKQDVLAKVLNQLVEQTPLPMLFMRTVIQAVGTFRSLVDFVMDILLRLVNKQIWKTQQLWVGFLKCASETAPHSFRVLLQLPTAQLENALTKYPKLKAPLAAHASQPSVRSSVPRSSQVLLGLIQDDAASETQDQQVKQD